MNLYSEDTSGYDERDEDCQSSEDEREYYCEICDREFPSEICLQRHVAEHRICGIDGCDFSAHPKLVEKHISMQHSTGLYHRMKNLSTPEDIDKWIMERKKRYPTKANIEHLKAEALEKQKRYEIIKEKKSVIELKKPKSEPKKTSRRKTRKRPLPLPVARKTTETQLYRGVQAFAGTLSLLDVTTDTECSLIEDSDIEVDERITAETLDTNKMDESIGCDDNKAISLSLVADYGTDSNEDNEPEEVPFKKVKVDTDNPESNNPEVSKQNDCRSDNGFRSRHNKNRNKQKESEKTQRNDDESKNERLGRFRRNQNRNTRGRTQKTTKIQLLSKLLSRSIQHERNLISQCIKYIVDNNYFE